MKSKEKNLFEIFICENIIDIQKYTRETPKICNKVLSLKNQDSHTKPRITKNEPLDAKILGNG